MVNVVGDAVCGEPEVIRAAKVSYSWLGIYTEIRGRPRVSRCVPLYISGVCEFFNHRLSLAYLNWPIANNQLPH